MKRRLVNNKSHHNKIKRRNKKRLFLLLFYGKSKQAWLLMVISNTVKRYSIKHFSLYDYSISSNTYCERYWRMCLHCATSYYFLFSISVLTTLGLEYNILLYVSNLRAVQRSNVLKIMKMRGVGCGVKYFEGGTENRKRQSMHQGKVCIRALYAPEVGAYFARCILCPDAYFGFRSTDWF